MEECRRMKLKLQVARNDRLVHRKGLLMLGPVRSARHHRDKSLTSKSAEILNALQIIPEIVQLRSSLIRQAAITIKAHYGT